MPVENHRPAASHRTTLSHNKTDCNNITEILLKMALNTIKQTNKMVVIKLSVPEQLKQQHFFVFLILFQTSSCQIQSHWLAVCQLIIFLKRIYKINYF